MASNLSEIEYDNGTGSNATGEENLPGTSNVFPQVLLIEMIIYSLWMIFQGATKYLWWHYSVSAVQISRILLIENLSKLIFVCGLLTSSEVWSRMFETRGLAVLFISCVCKLGTDLLRKLVEKNHYGIWGDISIMTCATLYLVILLVCRYGKKANLCGYLR